MTVGVAELLFCSYFTLRSRSCLSKGLWFWCLLPRFKSISVVRTNRPHSRRKHNASWWKRIRPARRSRLSGWNIKPTHVSPEVPRSPRRSRILGSSRSISMLKRLGSRSEPRASPACLSSVSLWFNSLLVAVYQGHSLCHVKIQWDTLLEILVQTFTRAPSAI